MTDHNDYVTWCDACESSHVEGWCAGPCGEPAPTPVNPIRTMQGIFDRAIERVWEGARGG